MPLRTAPHMYMSKAVGGLLSGVVQLASSCWPQRPTAILRSLSRPPTPSGCVGYVVHHVRCCTAGSRAPWGLGGPVYGARLRPCTVVSVRSSRFNGHFGDAPAPCHAGACQCGTFYTMCSALLLGAGPYGICVGRGMARDCARAPWCPYVAPDSTVILASLFHTPK